MKQNRLYLLFALVISSLIFVSCEDKDDEKVFGAQKCFNGIDDSLAGTGGAVAEVQRCIDKLGSVSNKDSQLLRCGIELWIGGINNTKIFGAFDQYEAAPENQKEATLMHQLVLADNPSGTATADRAYNYCKEAGAPGMIYVTALIKLGTYMQAAAGGTGTAADIVNECIANTGACSTAENGQMLIDTAGVYCIGESEENEVCQAMNAAIGNNPGNPAGVIADFLAQIDF